VNALAQELRAFGARVAIVEPGIIDTRIGRNIEGMAGSRVYPQVRRWWALFEGAIAAGAGQPQVWAGRFGRWWSPEGGSCGILWGRMRGAPGLARIDER